jgi:hypothetical protein
VGLWLTLLLNQALSNGEPLSTLDPTVKVIKEPQADDETTLSKGKLWRGQLAVEGLVFHDKFPSNLDSDDVAILQNYTYSRSQDLSKKDEEGPYQQTDVSRTNFNIKVTLQTVNYSYYQAYEDDSNIIAKGELSSIKHFAKLMVGAVQEASVFPQGIILQCGLWPPRLRARLAGCALRVCSCC